MGYAYYELDDGREAGYGVKATCDFTGCDRVVWRGLDELCGDIPLIAYYRERRMPDEWLGCGNYFCGPHSQDAHGCHDPRWDDDE